MAHRKIGVIGATAAALLVPGTGAFAHHGWTGYEQEARQVSGVISESSFTNPHGSIRLKADGKTWVVVLAPPSRMLNRGLTEDMLKPGATVSVEGYPHREAPDEMRAERISVNGKTIELR